WRARKQFGKQWKGFACSLWLAHASIRGGQEGWTLASVLGGILKKHTRIHGKFRDCHARQRKARLLFYEIRQNAGGNGWLTPCDGYVRIVSCLRLKSLRGKHSADCGM